MQTPATIGRYEILRLLGQGGMGRVFLAKDSVLGRKVAVKVLRDDLGIPPEVKKKLVDRMRQEARAAAALHHPNMVTLHDMGHEDSVGLFLVFEYIEGPNLRDRIGDGPLARSEVIELARALGDALTHAHEAGVIHRDVKPENVLVGEKLPKLTDFGLARIPDSTLTTAGSVLGTPAYSAPEALALAEFGPASDQFSLAATLYEALSGRRAFRGDDALSVASKVAHEDPPLLGVANPALRGVDSVLMKALSKGKRDRYPSCQAFGEALAAALEKIEDKKDGAAPRQHKRALPKAPRRWQNMTLGAGLLLIVAAYLVGRRAAEPEPATPGRSASSGPASTRVAELPVSHARVRPPPSAPSAPAPVATKDVATAPPSPAVLAPATSSAVPAASAAPIPRRDAEVGDASTADALDGD